MYPFRAVCRELRTSISSFIPVIVTASEAGRGVVAVVQGAGCREGHRGEGALGGHRGRAGAGRA